MNEKHNKNNNMTSSTKKYTHYLNSSNKYSEFYKIGLREKMNKLFNGSAEDKFAGLKFSRGISR